MEQHALKYSKGYAADKKKGTAWTFWSKDFDGMACKTMLRQLISKWGIMSVELQTALEKDMGVIHESGNVEYVDNMDFDESNIVDTPAEPVEAEVVESETKTTAKNVQDEFFS